MANRTVGIGIVVGLVVIIVILAGGMGYLLYNNSINSRNQSIASMSKEIATQNVTISQQNSTIASLESELNATVANLQSEINELQSLINNLENHTNSSNQSNSSVPLSATITEQSENTNYAVMTLSFSTPSNMTNLAGVTVSMTIPGATGGSPTLISFSGLHKTTTTSGTAIGPFGNSLGGSVYANSTTGIKLLNGTTTYYVWFGVTFSNVNPGDTSGLQSGALVTLYAFYSSTNAPPAAGKGSSIIYNWSGIAFSLNYKGYSGTAQVTLP